MTPTPMQAALVFALASLAMASAAPMPSPPPAPRADEPQVAHSVIFELKDHSPEGVKEFVGSCEKYLTGHKGSVSCAIGTIARDLVEPVSDRAFDVTVHVIFEDKSMLAAYLKSERHDRFVEAIKGKTEKVRVFDSYLTPASAELSRPAVPSRVMPTPAPPAVKPSSPDPT